MYYILKPKQGKAKNSSMKYARKQETISNSSGKGFKGTG